MLGIRPHSTMYVPNMDSIYYKLMGLNDCFSLKLNKPGSISVYTKINKFNRSYDLGVSVEK